MAMLKVRLYAVLMLLIGVGAGWFVYTSQMHSIRPFKLGLDLSGGAHLVYDADTSKLDPTQIPDSLTALQSVITRRVNSFGVSEAVVQTEQGGTLGNGDYRLVVELPGVTDLNRAIALNIARNHVSRLIQDWDGLGEFSFARKTPSCGQRCILG